MLILYDLNVHVDVITMIWYVLWCISALSHEQRVVDPFFMPNSSFLEQQQLFAASDLEGYLFVEQSSGSSFSVVSILEQFLEGSGFQLANSYFFGDDMTPVIDFLV